MGIDYLIGDSFTTQVVPLSVNLEQATSLIVERARQLVNQLIEDRGHDKPPFLPEEFARLQGIRKIVKADLGKVSAVLLRFYDGYVIKVNQNHNLARQNFSCAHEIGHTLLSELKLELNTEDIEYRTFNPQAHVIAYQKARERLYDVAATELLMPEFIFRKYLPGFGVSVHSIERLAAIFRISIRTAAWRIAEVSTEPCIALLWQPHRSAKSKALRLAWRVGPGKNREAKLTICQCIHLLGIPTHCIKPTKTTVLLNPSNFLRLITVLSVYLWNPKVLVATKQDMLFL